MRHEFCAEFEEVLIRPLHRYDIEYLRQWRNREDINLFLRNVGIISSELQEKWFRNYINDKNICFFAIDYMRKRTVGSLALYEFDGNKCQIGKIVIGEESARGYNVAGKSFLMAMGIAANFMKIESFYLSVHKENVAAKRIYERLGFKETGMHKFPKGGYEIEMSVTAKEIRALNNVTDIYFFRENGITMNIWGSGL